MKKNERVKDTREFQKIIETGKYLKNKYYIVHYQDNDLEYDRFGISVSKKLGNAVFRNKYKRKLRSIIDNYKKNYINHKDYIIILRKEAINKSFQELEKEFFALLNKDRKDMNK